MAGRRSSRALETYWRQVREVARSTGMSTADARTAVRGLRAMGIESANAYRRQGPADARRVLADLARVNAPEPYRGESRTERTAREARDERTVDDVFDDRGGAAGRRRDVDVLDDLEWDDVGEDIDREAEIEETGYGDV